MLDSRNTFFDIISVAWLISDLCRANIKEEGISEEVRQRQNKKMEAFG